MTALIINETLFCDTETDEEVLSLYFSRFQRLIQSWSAQKTADADTDWRLINVVYVSEDKAAWVEAIKLALTQSPAHPNIQHHLQTYRHPDKGYDFGPGAHIDQIKNPNKTSKFRDTLTRQATPHIRNHKWFQTAAFVARTYIDDDDLVAPHHFDNIAAQSAQGLAQHRESVYAFSFADAFICYSRENGVELNAVKFKTPPVGTKVIAFRDKDKFDSISPLSIHDRVDELAHAQFAERGIYLTLVENGNPSWCYMRRGNNLSQQDKSNFLSSVHSMATLPTEDDVLPYLSDLPSINYESHEFLPATTLVGRCRISANSIYASSNFEALRKDGDQVSYYLYRNGVKCAEIPYSAEGTPLPFPDIALDAGKYRLKVFIKRNGEVIDTATSNALTI